MKNVRLISLARNVTETGQLANNSIDFTTEIIATVAEAKSGLATDKLMTPALVKEAIGELGGEVYFAGDGLTQDGAYFNLDSSVVRTSGDQSIAGAKTFTSTIVGSVNGSAGTLATSRSIAMSGDGTWTVNFNGSENVTAAMTLANSGVSAGTYGKVTVDVKGRVTSGAALEASDIPNLDANKITSGIISIDRIPAAALERLIIVSNQVGRFALTTANAQVGDTIKQNDTGIMYRIIDDTKLNEEAGYVEYSAARAAAVDWSGVENKPSTFTPSSHTHGNISNAGAIGTTANLPIITTTSGVLTTGSFGTAANTFCEGNDARLTTNLGITAGTTAGPIVTSSTGTNATLPTASATASGVVTTSDQTWAGVKTFNSTITGSISGNAGTATTLQTARTINGVSFNGSANITITANTGSTLTRGTGLTGSNFNGSAATTWAVSFGTTSGTACEGNDTRLANEKTQSFTATLNQTTFTITNGYLANRPVKVFHNGVRLMLTDYTATNGTSVVLSSGCNENDNIIIDCYQV
jgi:hypothetical protein